MDTLKKILIGWVTNVIAMVILGAAIILPTILYYINHELHANCNEFVSVASNYVESCVEEGERAKQIISLITTLILTAGFIGSFLFALFDNTRKGRI